MLTHKGTQQIETPRLILRQAVREDAEPMLRNWASDPEVTKFLTWPTHDSIAVSSRVLEDWISQYQRSDYYQWMIVLKEIGEPIGSISVVRQNDRVEEAEIGYCIGSKWWHRGIMSEALAAVIRYLFTEVGMNRIAARHDPNNPHSGGVMRKCGMIYEGTNRACDRNNQGICDAAQYAILRRDWENPLEKYGFQNDAGLVQEFYRSGSEDNRLRSQAARVEFLTTVRYIEKYLTPGARILDIGAGTGVYSLHFARQGYTVSTLELSEDNVAVFRDKLTASDPVDLRQGDARDLSGYADDSFDIVLMFGPLYHLHNEQDRLRCIEEAKRVCKPGGKLFFAFISNDIVILTMQQVQPDYLLQGYYDKDTFQLDDIPFQFHTVPAARHLLEKADISLCHEVAADGVSELLKDLVNGLDEESYQQYLRYHFYLCEKPECLGMSNHLLFVGEKKLSRVDCPGENTV